MSTFDDYQAERRARGGCLLLVVLLGIAVAGGILVWRYWPQPTGLNPQAQLRPVAARGNLNKLESANIDIYELASPSLVQVTNLQEQSVSLFGLDRQEVPKGVGSGFIWDEDGHIVTNYHVVQGADSARVTLFDNSTYDTQQIWAYPDADIAVLWIDAPRSKLHPILVGRSHDLKVGQITYALGDPYGLDGTMTTGIVSALNRTIDSASGQPIRGVIQTSAAINPGNSGGPLLDSAGRLIGMNTAILSSSGSFAGIGFAIPVDEINRLATQLIQHGKVNRPRLGVQVASDDLARHLGVDKGALIIKVVPNSPAAKAGLRGTGRDQQGQIQLGDVITAINDKTIEHGDDLQSDLLQFKAGDKLTLTIIRDNKQQKINVTLDASE